jgi:virginiamycin B lyase
MFPTPKGSEFVEGLAAGVDGDMWFTDPGTNSIDQITPSGTVTAFPIPTMDSSPFGIAAGPGGVMWFTEAAMGKIGQITATGQITELSVPGANPGPSGIAAGPDGEMWFSEERGNEVGEILPTGKIVEFRIPVSGSDSYGIAAGPGNEMWLTGVGGNRIGSVGDGPPLVDITHAAISTSRRTASFRFTAVAAATGFECALAAHRAKPQYVSCRSPKTYRALSPGTYTFEVRALNGTLAGSTARSTFSLG